MWMAGLFCALNSFFIIFGLYGLKYTGYGFDYLSDEYAAYLAGTGPVPSPTKAARTGAAPKKKGGVSRVSR